VVLNSAEEVKSALKIVKKTGCKFAMRTSGHNPNVGFSSVDESRVVFDLRGLNAKSLDADGVLHAGAGNRWGVIYQYLQEKGLSLIGSRDVQVGLGGFLTGGIVFFSSLQL
jgi:FAD/FMN-containing dehydrogenase